MNLLKKGDKIRMTRNFGALSVGDILTIQAVDKKDESMPYLAGGYWLSANCFEPVSEFHAGQIYMLIDKDSGDIVGIAKFLGCANDHKSMQWRTIRTDAGQTFVRHTSYQLLTGKEIGKAIRKWDAGHAKKDRVKEVKREAKPGEYIKLIRAPYPFDRVGDILRMGKEGLYILGKDHPRKTCDADFPWCYISEHYVVLEGYKPQKKGKHVYTAEQIAEAKGIVLDMIHDVYADDSEALFLGSQDKKVNYAVLIANGTNCRLDTGSGPFGNPATIHADDSMIGHSKCSDHDEPNEWIGKCVALCKALHKPIPAFIMEGVPK